LASQIKTSRLALFLDGEAKEPGGFADRWDSTDAGNARLCSKHKIACDFDVVPIQKVNEAYERVLKSDVRYRFVIDMAKPR
jgi:hypothetical protein